MVWISLYVFLNVSLAVLHYRFSIVNDNKNLVSHIIVRLNYMKKGICNVVWPINFVNYIAIILRCNGAYRVNIIEPMISCPMLKFNIDHRPSNNKIICHFLSELAIINWGATEEAVSPISSFSVFLDLKRASRGRLL